jgi:hypothetical protein
MNYELRYKHQDAFKKIGQRGRGQRYFNIRFKLKRYQYYHHTKYGSK